MLIAWMQEVFVTEKETKLQENDLEVPEINVTVHYTANGPSLESCLISILSIHLSKK